MFTFSSFSPVISKPEPLLHWSILYHSKSALNLDSFILPAIPRPRPAFLFTFFLTPNPKPKFNYLTCSPVSTSCQSLDGLQEAILCCATPKNEKTEFLARTLAKTGTPSGKQAKQVAAKLRQIRRVRICKSKRICSFCSAAFANFSEPSPSTGWGPSR